MEGFTHIEIEIDTDATGYVTAEVGFTVDFSREDRPGLVSIDEISVEGGPWLSFKQLQAQHGRTLAHELALHTALACEDNDLWDQLIEEAHQNAIDDAAEYAYEASRDF